MGDPKHDLTGQTFGRLTVIRETNHRNPTKGRMWECRCECGNLHLANTWNLRSGKTKSCGCLQRELFKRQPGNYYKEEFTPKEDCVSFRGDHCDCLNEMLCKKKSRCAFYKKG